MNSAYFAAGILALIGAGIHGGIGEATVVRRLDPATLPATRWGSPHSTLRLIRGTWHMLTTTFAAFGVALLVAAVQSPSPAGRGVATLIAATSAAFASMAILGSLATRNPAALVRHPAPALLTAVAILAYLGSRA